MENKNILLLRYHPMNVHFTNSFYTSQAENELADYTIVDVTSRILRNKAFMGAQQRPTGKIRFIRTFPVSLPKASSRFSVMP